MPPPKVFISSTFYDFKHIRSSLEYFIENLGYEPVLSEYGSIAYDPDMSLEQSCYRDVRDVDIFVLIIGGRYGSPAKSDDNRSEEFLERYQSITKKEYLSALEAGIPIYILIESNVYHEYKTFQRNRDNNTIEYAHVDTINIFYFIDEIILKSSNNPIFQFEKHVEIEEWLKKQWAGLFREYIKRRSDNKQISSLSEKVDELSTINETLKRYLESVIKNTASNENEAGELIESEKERIENEKHNREFSKMLFVQQIMDKGATLEEVINIVSKSISFENFANLVARYPASTDTEQIIANLKNNDKAQKNINEARKLLGLDMLDFERNIKNDGQQNV